MIYVSDLNKHDFCPRAIFLSNYLGIKSHPTKNQIKGLLEHAIRKEISYRQSRILKKSDTNDLKKLMAAELEKIILDAPHIYKEKLPPGFEEFLTETRIEVEKELELLEGKLNAMVTDMGFNEALNYLTPTKLEYSIRSKELNLSGRIDKIYKRESLIPAEIKTGKPSVSIWPGDRIQTVAFCMMCDEKFKEQIPYGMVEYTQNFEEKPVLNTEKTRREVIYTRDSVQEIIEGNDPGICPHGNPRKCENCGLKEECYKT